MFDLWQFNSWLVVPDSLVSLDTQRHDSLENYVIIDIGQKIGIFS